MPLISRSGSSTPPSNPGTPVSVNDLLAGLPVVRNPALDKMAFDTQQYPDATSAILGYMEGHRLPVTYFNLQGFGGTDIRTNIADSVSERNLVNTAYMRINNFEITLTAAWTFNYDPATTESSVNGEALFYPGVNPLINDVFLTAGGDNKLALFKITSVSPLSWRNRRAYQVTFTFWKFPENQDIQLLEAATIQTVYFDKVNYLDDTVSVLEEDRYRDLITLRQMRDVLSKYYVNSFFDYTTDTYFPPSGVYDPYVVRYMSEKIPFDLVKKRPRQLQSSVELTFSHSIWQRLLDRYTSTWDDVWANFTIVPFVGRSMDVNLTPLVNRTYMRLVPNGGSSDPPDPNGSGLNQTFLDLVADDPGILAITNYGPWAEDPSSGTTPVPYVLSPAFYTNTTGSMTPFETMLAATLTTRVWTDSQTLINTYLNQYRTLSLNDQFYLIPFYLHLIDVTVASLARAV